MTLHDRRTYRGIIPKRTKNGYVDDRTIVRIDTIRRQVHYRSMMVAHAPRVVSYASFERWASHDVSEQLPAGCYMSWEQYLQEGT